MQAGQDDGDKEPWNEHQRERHQVLPPARAAGGHDPADRDQGAGFDDEDAEGKAQCPAPWWLDQQQSRRSQDQPEAELDQPVQAGKNVSRGRVTHLPV